MSDKVEIIDKIFLPLTKMNVMLTNLISPFLGSQLSSCVVPMLLFPPTIPVVPMYQMFQSNDLDGSGLARIVQIPQTPQIKHLASIHNPNQL